MTRWLFSTILVIYFLQSLETLLATSVHLLGRALSLSLAVSKFKYGAQIIEFRETRHELNKTLRLFNNPGTLNCVLSTISTEYMAPIPW
jgi:hypothetical protein